MGRVNHDRIPRIVRGPTPREREAKRRAALVPVEPVATKPPPRPSRVLRGAAMALRFLRAHAGGTVSPTMYRERWAACSTCPHLRRDKEVGEDYCSRLSCRCPKSKRWPFPQLRWRLWLLNFACPIGRWVAKKI